MTLPTHTNGGFSDQVRAARPCQRALTTPSPSSPSASSSQCSTARRSRSTSQLPSSPVGRFAVCRPRQRALGAVGCGLWAVLCAECTTVHNITTRMTQAFAGAVQEHMTLYPRPRLHNRQSHSRHVDACVMTLCVLNRWLLLQGSWPTCSSRTARWRATRRRAAQRSSTHSTAC